MKKLVSFKTTKPKSPSEIIRHTNDVLEVLLQSSKESKSTEKIFEEVTKCIKEIKDLLYGNTEKYPTEETSIQIASEIFRCNFLRLLINCVPFVDFESRKAISQIAVKLQGQFVNSRLIASDYFSNNLDLIDLLFQGYENYDIALFYGAVLRESVRHQFVAKYLLTGKHFPIFFKYFELPNFEVASDAAATFKELLTRHKSTVSEYLSKNYEYFLTLYNPLLESSNYATRRIATKILSEVFHDKSNAAYLKCYVHDLNNLQIVMNLFKGQSKAIQIEAFHLFKEFVLETEKPKEIISVLSSNKEKLLNFLTNLVLDKENPQFESDKANVIDVLKEL